MLNIGLTGGIGSGKSTIAKIFEVIGIPVFEADKQAKDAYQDKEIVNQLHILFGNSIFDNGRICFARLSDRVFNNRELLSSLNGIIHPFVIRRYSKWIEDQKNKDYIIMESAILFETGLNQIFDFIITVSAPRSLCVRRVMQRDNLTKEAVNNIMKNQSNQKYNIKRSDFVIINDGIQPVLPQVLKIHQHLTLNSCN